MLKGVTQLIANTPNSISASASAESSIVARVGQHLGERSAADQALFHGLHEQLSAYVSCSRLIRLGVILIASSLPD